MKISYYLSIISGLILFSACTEEKTFSFTGKEKNCVNFSVDNISIPGNQDMAESVIPYYNNEYYEVSKDSISRFTITAVRLDDNYKEERTFENYYKNVIYAGGNNILYFTFRPSCAEEKSARFTMPDGKVYEVTVSNPSFEWMINRSVIESIPNVDIHRLVVTAESEYTKNGNIYNNKGYVLINVSEMQYFYYNSGNSQWYYNNWLEGENLFQRKGLLFDAFNITVGENDNATSTKYEYGYYEEWTDNPKSFSLDIHGMPGTSDSLYLAKHDITLNYRNVLWAGRNNEIKIVYKPSSKYEANNTAVFTMPDGQSFKAGGNDTVFVWTLDSASFANSINTSGGRLVIDGYCKYSDAGIDTEAHGHILIDVDKNISFNKSDNKWYLDKWGY